MPTALLYVLQLLNAIPSLIASGQSVMTLINHGTVALQNMVAEKRDPSPAEWADLNTLIDGLRTQLHS